ncbi:hypothetical protein FrEUN1fDRAFT_2883 [Parafrankia sp. EUN1f]|nr:hypothetical protein FrEUN1fDRAFT_2883 [Parafrankia sp. EUN1f]
MPIVTPEAGDEAPKPAYLPDRHSGCPRERILRGVTACAARNGARPGLPGVRVGDGEGSLVGEPVGDLVDEALLDVRRRHVLDVDDLELDGHLAHVEVERVADVAVGAVLVRDTQ